MARYGKTHGMSNTPTYRSWKSMLERCTNRNHKYYFYYGGKGITVCSRWRHSFSSFLADMGVRPDGHTLDRKNGNKGYTKLNCRWASNSVQGRNRSNNHLITWRGKTKTMPEWAEILGIKRNSLASSICRQGVVKYFTNLERRTGKPLLV